MITRKLFRLEVDGSPRVELRYIVSSGLIVDVQDVAASEGGGDGTAQSQVNPAAYSLENIADRRCPFVDFAFDGPLNSLQKVS